MNEEIDLSREGDTAMLHFEGNVLHVYLDQAKRSTIGKGHLCSAAELVTGSFAGGTIHAVRDAQGRWSLTAEQSNQLFRFDLHRFVVDLRRLYAGPRKLKPNEQDAIILWDFNTGGLAHSGVLTALNEGRYDDVPAEMLRWNHIRDKETGQLVVCDDLTARRKAEVSIWQNGYGHPDTEAELKRAATEAFARNFDLRDTLESGGVTLADDEA